ncbi:MAG: ribosome maturation factor RimP [Betaproteobacteria bacterium]|nr:ribosome maturation factor RimP [Betaproteobacteria bacterium]
MDIAGLLERTLLGLGYELVDLEASPRARILRVFIDRPGGIDVEDCAGVSNHLTRLFAVEGIDYDRLEVSSPGLDRPLKKESDFVRFAGEEVQFKLHLPVGNARKLKGVLQGVVAGKVQVVTAQGPVEIALENVERARLVPRIEWR